MKTQMTYALRSKEGKHLIRKSDNKDVGEFIWCAPNMNEEDFLNVGEIEERLMLIADEGKQLVFGEQKSTSVWAQPGEEWVEEDYVEDKKD